MDFIKGHTIKPNEVKDDGRVLFTDGTNNDLYANEKTCKAYGYRYVDGMCVAFQPQENVESIKLNTAVKGKNKLHPDTNVHHVQGYNNETKGNNNLIFVNGVNHIVNRDIQSTAILTGLGGESRTHGEAVLNAHNLSNTNTISDTATSVMNAGQLSTIILNCETTDNTQTTMTALVNQPDATGVYTDYIPIPLNSIIGIEMYVSRLEVGGTSGTAGNFSYRRNQQCVRVARASTTFTNFNTKNIAKLGVNGSFTIEAADITDEEGIAQRVLQVKVTDRNNVINKWSAILYMHILRTDLSF
tara:strand:- start:789 stop:1688 length:900 start_codon:yes stop_codon:yes gene_type:complete